uniref:Uncharacterized protein n=1 Tax=Globisporangium ultimum (strain ATCC 200006 / CBS 805.95 / DAOM BR144) TaxID=431595 RepID=K3XAN5_GLOUD
MRVSKVVSALLLVLAAAVDARQVSVCRDATFDVPAAHGAICSGVGDAPTGTACPKKGDVSVSNCQIWRRILERSKAVWPKRTRSVRSLQTTLGRVCSRPSVAKGSYR